jgi:hypothetical protein
MNTTNTNEIEEYLLDADLKLYSMILNHIEKLEGTSDFQRVDMLVNTLQIVQGNIERSLKSKKRKELFNNQRENLWKNE